MVKTMGKEFLFEVLVTSLHVVGMLLVMSMNVGVIVSFVLGTGMGKVLKVYERKKNKFGLENLSFEEM